MSTTAAWPVLSPLERRVLGVLVEKQKTTPDAYPMSLNGLVTGCNQKSNRDPVLTLEDFEVEEALTACQKKGLVIKIEGSGRVEKWRHNLYDAWKTDKTEMAVLAELLLRGPQTEGELRGRASRMEPINDLDALRALLAGLAQRKLVVYLSPEGRRGTVVTHGFHDPAELGPLRQRFAAGEAEPAPAARPAPAAATAPDRLAPLERQLADAQAQIAQLRGEVAHLTDLTAAQQKQLADLAGQVRRLQADLGVAGSEPGA
jgi:uncharacterized protein